MSEEMEFTYFETLDDLGAFFDDNPGEWAILTTILSTDLIDDFSVDIVGATRGEMLKKLAPHMDTNYYWIIKFSHYPRIDPVLGDVIDIKMRVTRNVPQGVK